MIAAVRCATCPKGDRFEHLLGPSSVSLVVPRGWRHSTLGWLCPSCVSLVISAVLHGKIPTSAGIVVRISGIEFAATHIQITKAA